MIAKPGMRVVHSRCGRGLRGLLHLLLAFSLALYALAPAGIVVADSAPSGHPVAWTLPDGSAVPICQALPGGADDGRQQSAIHCSKCIVVGHVVAQALSAPCAAMPSGTTDAVVWPAPVRAAVVAQAHRSQSARAPPARA